MQLAPHLRGVNVDQWRYRFTEQAAWLEVGNGKAGSVRDEGAVNVEVEHALGGYLQLAVASATCPPCECPTMAQLSLSVLPSIACAAGSASRMALA